MILYSKMPSDIEPSYVYYTIDGKNILILVFDPNLKQDIEVTRISGRNLGAKAETLQSLGFTVNDKVVVVRSVICLDDTLNDVKSKICWALAKAVNKQVVKDKQLQAIDLCMFSSIGNLEATRMDSNLISEIQFKLLGTKIFYLQKSGGEVVNRQPFIFNGNPYHYQNVNKNIKLKFIANEIKLKKGGRRSEELEIEIENMSNSLLVSVLNQFTNQIELFVSDRLNFIEQQQQQKRPDYTELHSIYWYEADQNYGIKQTPVNTSITYSDDDMLRVVSAQLRLTQGELDVNQLPASFSINDYDKFCKLSMPDGNDITIMEGFTGGLMFGMKVSKAGEVNLSGIFNSMSTSETVPFMKFNTGIQRKDVDLDDSERQEKANIMYDKMYRNFVENKKNLAIVRESKWFNTNRKLHTSEIGNLPNQYYNMIKRSIIFQLSITKSGTTEPEFITVSLRYDGSVVVVFTSHQFWTPEELIDIFGHVNRFLIEVCSHDDGTSVPALDVSRAKSLLGTKSTDIGATVLLQQYLESVGIKLFNFDYVCDIKWKKNVMFSSVDFENQLANHFNQYVREVTLDGKKYGVSDKAVKLDSNVAKCLDMWIQRKKIFKSDFENKILYYKKINAYEDFLNVDDKCKPSNKSSKKKFTTMIVYHVKKITNNCIRILFINIHNLFELEFALPFAKKALFSFFKETGDGEAEAEAETEASAEDDEDDEEEEGEYELAEETKTFRDKLNELSQTEDESCRRDTRYKSGELMSIHAILAPHTRNVRALGKTHQVFGITYHRYLTRLLKIMDVILEIIGNLSEETRTKLAKAPKEDRPLLVKKCEEVQKLIENYVNTNSTEHKITLMRDTYGEKGLLYVILQELFDNYDLIKAEYAPKVNLAQQVQEQRGGGQQEQEKLVKQEKARLQEQERLAKQEEARLLLFNRAFFLLLTYYLGLTYEGVHWVALSPDNLFERRPNDRLYPEDDLIQYRIDATYINDPVKFIDYIKPKIREFHNYFNEQGGIAEDDREDARYAFIGFVGFHSQEIIDDKYFVPKRFKRMKIKKNDYGKPYKSTLEKLEKNVWNTRDVQTEVATREVGRNWRVYKREISKSGIGAESFLPKTIIERIGEPSNYHLLYCDYKMQLDSFLQPFCHLAFEYRLREFNKLVSGTKASMTRRENYGKIVRDRIIAMFKAKPYMFYFFRNGTLPATFGNCDKFIEFLEQAYLNEDFLWDIVTFPGWLSAEGFNLYIIDATRESDIKLELPIGFKYDTVFRLRKDRPRKGLILLKNSFGYHVISKIEEHQTRTWFFDETDKLLSILTRTVNSTFKPNKQLHGRDLIDLIESAGKKCDVKSTGYILDERENTSHLIVEHNKIKLLLPLHVGENYIKAREDESSRATNKDRLNLTEYTIFDPQLVIDLPDYESFLPFYNCVLQHEWNSFGTDDYTIKTLLALPTVKGTASCVGVRFNNGLLFYFKPVSIERIASKPELAGLTVEHDHWQTVYFDQILAKKYSANKLAVSALKNRNLLATHVFHAVKQELSRFFSQNAEIKEDLATSIKKDQHDIVRSTLRTILDLIVTEKKISEYSFDGTPRSLYRLTDIGKVLKSSSQMVGCMDTESVNSDRQSSPHELDGRYKLTIPQEVYTRDMLANMLADELMYNRFSMDYMGHDLDTAGGTGPINVSEIAEFLLDNTQTPIFLENMESYIDDKFVRCNITGQHYLGSTDQMMTIYFAMHPSRGSGSSYKQLIIAVPRSTPITLYLENDLISPHDPHQLFNIYLEYLDYRNPDRRDVFGEIYEYLVKKPGLVELYLDYLKKLYSVYYNTTKLRIAGGDDLIRGLFSVKQTMLVATILGKVNIDAKSKSIGLDVFIKKYHFPSDIDYLILAVIKGKNLMVLIDELPGESFLYNYNKNRDDWLILFKKGHLMYPLVDINLTGQIRLNSQQLLNRRDVHHLFAPKKLEHMAINNLSFHFDEPIRFMVRGLGESTPRDIEKSDDIPQHSALFTTKQVKSIETLVFKDVKKLDSNVTPKRGHIKKRPPIRRSEDEDLEEDLDEDEIGDDEIIVDDEDEIGDDEIIVDDGQDIDQSIGDDDIIVED